MTGYRLPISYVNVSSDPDAYRRLLQELWHEQRDVVLIEHDVLPWPGAIEELAGCPGLWCSCSYAMNGGGPGIYHALGCTKLSAKLMAIIPDVWDAPQPWHVLDQVLFFAARAVGYEPHAHRPPVIHLHPQDTNEIR